MLYKIFTFFISLIIFLFISGNSFAQLSGIKTIPGDYATIALAVTDLNTNGVGAGGVTFNIAAGYNEVAANLIITATGTSANPIIFQKSGSGNNPAITAGVGTSTTVDGIIKLSGTDYITFDGLDLKDTSSNITTTTQMEWGYAVLKVDGTNGCRFVTIKNCTVTLTQTNTAAIGIYSANHTVSATTALTVTDTNGTNSYNKFYSNIISNVNSGIWIGGYSTAAYYDQGNEVGTTGTGRSRVFSYGSTTTAYGVYAIYQGSMKVFNTSVNNSGGTPSTSTLYGIFLSTGTNSNVDITGDTVTVVGGGTTSQLAAIYNNMGTTGTSNNVNITNNVVQNCTYTTATSAANYYIYHSAACYNLNATGNKIINNTYGSASVTATGSTYYLYTLGGTATNNLWQLNNNIISNNSRVQSTAGTGIVYSFYCSGSAPNVTTHDNIISDNTWPTSTSTAYLFYLPVDAVNLNCYNNTVKNITRINTSAAMYCYYLTGGTAGGVHNIYNNSLNNLNITSTGATYCYYLSSAVDKNVYQDSVHDITSSGSIYGLYHTAGLISQVYNNYIYNFNTTGTVYGLYYSGTTSGTVYSNKVYNLTSTTGAVYASYISGAVTCDFYKNSIYDVSTTTGTIYGCYIVGGTTNYLYNNFISDLQSTASTSAVGIAGIYSSGGTNNFLFYNTIYLNAVSSSVTTFGTAGIYASTTPTLDMRDNIIVNISTPGPTGGYTSAYFRNAFNLSTYANTSNNNVFYAGTPSANHLIYNDGSNLLQTIAQYKQMIAPRETNSFTENPPFVNVITTPYDLHISTSIPTGIEGAGIPITSPIAVNNDFDNQTRNSTTPDIGADEGTFTSGDLQPPTISYTPLISINSTSNRTLVATITDNMGVQNTSPNDPRIYYKKGVNGTYVYRNKTSLTGNDYTFTLVTDSLGSLAVGDTVFYYVAAQDNESTPPLPANGSTNPLGGGGINPPGNVPPPTPNKYIIIQPPLTGSFSIPGSPYATLSAALNDITLRGMGTGGVTLNVAAGYTETASNLLIEALGSSLSNPLIIQKSGTGANPLITASAGTGTMDGIIRISGTDYVTIDGIDVREDTVNNTTSVTQMEWGFALLKTDGTNGARNCTIKNCSITLWKSNLSSIGIYANNHTPYSTSPIIVSDSMGANSNNKFYNNSISNVNTGIWLGGYLDAAYYDMNNEIGNTAGMQNKIFNFGSTTTAYGIYVIYQNGMKIFNTNVNSAGGIIPTSVIYGIYTSTGINSNLDIYGDTITVASGGTTSIQSGIYNTTGTTGTNNTINIYNNVIQNCTYETATSATVYYLYNSAGAYNLNIYGNKIINNVFGSASVTATGTMYYLYAGGGTASSNNWQIYNNVISNNSRVQSALGTGIIYTLYTPSTGPTLNLYGNTISDNVWPSTSSIYGLYITSSYILSLNCYNNTIKNISRPNLSTGPVFPIYISGGAAGGVGNVYKNSVNNISITGAGYMYGIYYSNTNVDKNIYQDTIYNLTTAGNYIYGIYSSSGITTKIYQNKIYGISSTTDTTAYVYGMYVTSGTTNTIYNNFISDLKAPASSVTPAAVAGIYFTAGTTNNVFDNTIYLNAVSTSLSAFSTAGIYMTASASYTLDMRNNIIDNNSTPGPTGLTVAYRRSSTTLTSYSSNSNNNDFYAGTPSATNLIFTDGTNSDQTIAAFQTRVTPRDNNSFTENPPFINVAAVPYDLHISASTPTFCESHGIPITTPIAVNNDYDNQTRNVTTPDVGADEGTFTANIPNTPALVAPLNNAIGVPVTPTLDWSDVTFELSDGVLINKDDATTYQLQVSKDSTFATTVVNQTAIATSQYIVPSGILGRDTSYFWKVRAYNGMYGSWSGVWKFTTEGFVKLNLTIVPGGFYNTSTGKLNMRDTIRLYLIDTVGGGHKVDSSKAVIDSVTFTSQFKFDNAPSGNYYVYIYHRNHIPISTANLISLNRTAPVSYNMTDLANKTFGSNVVQVSTSPVVWGMIPGDANKDEYVDAIDQQIWIAQNGLDGYLSADFNGDIYVDAIDQQLWITYNGNSSFLPWVFSVTTLDPQAKIKNSKNEQERKVIINSKTELNNIKSEKENQHDLNKNNLKK